MKHKSPTETLGYGDPLSDEGTQPWAQRVHIVILSGVDGAKFSAHHLTTLIEKFVIKQAWRLLTNGQGNHYVHFKDYVTTPKPFGLGSDYEKFRSLISSEIGEREFDRLTASEPVQGMRTDKTSGHNVPKSNEKKSKRLRAINRAPEIIQKLYDRDLIGVDVAAKFGPKLPEPKPDDSDEERDKKLAEARRLKDELAKKADALQRRVETLEIFEPDLKPNKAKVRINTEARELLELKVATPLEQLRNWWAKASDSEREQHAADVVEWLAARPAH